MHRQFDSTNESRSLWSWSGRAGVAGSVAMLALFIFVGVTVGDDPADTAGWIMRFPAISGNRVVENGTYLLVLVLWMLHFAGLGHRLMTHAKATALFGAVLGVVGLSIMAAGALPHVAMAPLSDLYFAPSAGEAEKATLALIFRASWWMFDALLIAGQAVLSLALGLMALALAHDGGYGRGWTIGAAALAIAAIGSVVVVLINPASLMVAVGVFAQVFFHMGFGWRLTRIARAPS